MSSEAIELSTEPISGELLEPLRPKPLGSPLAELVEETAAAFRVSSAEVLSRDRHSTIADARHVVAWRIRKQWGWSFPHIGKVLALDHTTIMSAVRKIDREIANGSGLGAAALSLYRPVVVRRIAGAGVVLELEEGPLR
jgi:chromosomal replication initiation ATPase DnaA